MVSNISEGQWSLADPEIQALHDEAVEKDEDCPWPFKVGDGYQWPASWTSCGCSVCIRLRRVAPSWAWDEMRRKQEAEPKTKTGTDGAEEKKQKQEEAKKQEEEEDKQPEKEEDIIYEC